MEEKKVTKISLGTAICIVIIVFLIIALGITYYLGFIKKDVNKQQINSNSNENAQISSTINTSNQKSVTNSEIINNKIKMPTSKNIVTIGTTRDTVKSYIKLDKNIQDDGTASSAHYNIIKPVNNLTYYLYFDYVDNKIKDISIWCAETKDGITTINSQCNFNTVKEFYKDFSNVDVSQEEGLIIVNIDDEFNNISIVHKFTNNKLANIELYLNASENNNIDTVSRETTNPLSSNYMTIGTTRDTVKSYTKLDKNLQDDGTASSAHYTIIKPINNLTYYLYFDYVDNKIKDISVWCTETKDGIATINSQCDFNTVKEFYKDFSNVDVSQEKDIIIVNIKDEFNNISIKHQFSNNKLNNITLYLN